MRKLESVKFEVTRVRSAVPNSQDHVLKACRKSGSTARAHGHGDKALLPGVLWNNLKVGWESGFTGRGRNTDEGHELWVVWCRKRNIKQSCNK